MRFLITASYTCGFTARIMYFALLAHSAFPEAALTPVSSLTVTLFLSVAHEKTISAGE